MSDMSATVLLILVVAAFAWAVFRVLSTLQAGGQSAKRANYGALGGSAPEDLSHLQHRHDK